MLIFRLSIDTPEPEQVRHEIQEWAEELAHITGIPIENIQVTEDDCTDH